MSMLQKLDTILLLELFFCLLLSGVEHICRYFSLKSHFLVFSNYAWRLPADSHTLVFLSQNQWVIFFF